MGKLKVMFLSLAWATDGMVVSFTEEGSIRETGVGFRL